MDSDLSDSQPPEWDDQSYDAMAEEAAAEYVRLKSTEMYELLKNVDSIQEVLSQWQREHPVETVYLHACDFRNADFSGTNLEGADLQGANLQGANLTIANLEGAFLTGTKLQGASLRHASLQRAFLRKAELQGADLTGATLEDADLEGANLQGANLQGSNLERVNLRGANLQDANLARVSLQGTSLVETKLCGVYARFAMVDGVTLLDECLVDDGTDFAGVGLDNARLAGQLKARLKRNIRKQHWEGHIYQYKKWSADQGQLVESSTDPIIHKGRYTQQPFLQLARPFWWVSDYGSSAARLLLVFLAVSWVFAFLYLLPTVCSYIPPFVQGLDTYKGQQLAFGLRCIRALYLSIVTMTTLGFGDIIPYPLSYVGHILVIVQVCLGYLLLGALITRLAVLFQEVE
jgi:uncharacterized protein YjbI with pentapeptide repeats